MQADHACPTTEAELRVWIEAGVEENLGIEYKRAAALSRNSPERLELSKDVSAMANAAGGLLFYGVAEHPRGNGKDHLPANLDPIADPAITKEWLQQVINAGIRPRILDLEILPIRIAPPTPGVVFAIRIPQGATAHQADDRRYYRRFNFVNEPMYDHEIRDVMGRAKHPIVKLLARIHVAPAQHFLTQLESIRKFRWLKLGLSNEGTKVAQHVTAFVNIPYELLAFPDKEWGASCEELQGKSFARFVLSNKTVEGRSPLLGPHKVEGPLLPGLSINVKTVGLVGPEQVLPDEAAITAHIFADEAPPRVDVFSINELASDREELADNR